MTTKHNNDNHGYDPDAPHGSLTKTIVGENPQLPLIARISFVGMKAFFWGGLIVFGLAGAFINLIS
jgi:hypothetical protein